MSQSMREIVCDILTRDAAGETLEEMVSALEDIRSAALEEAAHLAEHFADESHEIWHEQEVAWGDKIAAAIRALKEAERV